MIDISCDKGCYFKIMKVLNCVHRLWKEDKACKKQLKFQPCNINLPKFHNGNLDEWKNNVNQGRMINSVSYIGGDQVK